MIKNIFALSDSQVVLHWINSTSPRSQSFVNNRINKIKENLNKDRWFYVSSKNNPADPVSRGVKVAQLKGNDFWWKGPPWLVRNYSDWPISRDFCKKENMDNLGDGTQTMVCTEATREKMSKDNPILQLIDNVSSWTKLIRIMGYILKFGQRAQIIKNIFSADDMNIAGEYLL